MMIKKLTHSLLAFALVGGLFSCNKESGNATPEPTPSTGDTYMSISIATSQLSDGLKAAKEDDKHNSIGEYEGRDKIENLTVYVISLPEGTVTKQEFQTADLTTQTGVSEYRTKAWKTDAGKKEVYVLANISGTEIKTKLDAAMTSKSAFETAYAAEYELTDGSGVKSTYAKYDKASMKDIIAMNGKTKEPVEVIGGVKEEQAKNGSNNCFKVDLRRLVAQAVVTRNASDDMLKIMAKRNGTEKLIATLSDLKWDVMQFEKKTYLDPMATQAGMDATRVMYCKTPSFEFVPTDLNNFESEAKSKYFYRNMEGETVETFTRQDAGNNKKNVDSIVKKTMKFVTETTHKMGGKLAADGGSGDETGYRKGNTPYVLVSAKVKPADDVWGTSQKDAYTDGSDLYYGLHDGLFYCTMDAAKTANGGDEKNVIKYASATCYYVAWLNPDTPAEPLTSPVLRNNIYHVNIKSFKNIGYTGNPLNPNKDNPKDPNENKTPEPGQTLYPVDTYMAVEITVVNWGVHSYDAEL